MTTKKKLLLTGVIAAIGIALVTFLPGGTKGRSLSSTALTSPQQCQIKVTEVNTGSGASTTKTSDTFSSEVVLTSVNTFNVERKITVSPLV